MKLLFVDEDRMVLMTRPSPKTVNLGVQLEGRRRWLKKGGWQLEPTTHNLELVRGAYPDLIEEGKSPPDRFAENFHNLPTARYVSRTEPWPHQEDCLRKMRDKNEFAVFAEQGTGKTKIGCDWAGYLFASGRITALLVIAPAGVHRQWVEPDKPQGELLGEVQRHCGVPTVTHAWRKRARADLDIPDKLMPGEELRVFSINIDALRTVRGQAAAMRYVKWHAGRVLMIVDESHRIKNKSSNSWRSADAVGGRCSHRLIMTGTPIAKDPTDEWSQYYFLNPRIIGMKYKTAFRNEYCLLGGHTGFDVVGARNVERLQKRVEPYTYRVTKSEIGIAAKVQAPPVRFSLTRDQRGMIKTMKQQLIAQIGSGEISTAANAAVGLVRIQQIASGFFVDDDETVHWVVPPEKNPRLQALAELLESKRGDVCIWARFIQDILLVAELLGDECVTYYGETSTDDRERNKTRFLTDSRCRYFVSNPAAGGTGLNLQLGGCTEAIYYTNSYNSIQRWQSEDRIHRIGTAGICVYTDLQAIGSTDAAMRTNISRKRAMAARLLGDESHQKDDEQYEVQFDASEDSMSMQAIMEWLKDEL